MQARMIEGFKLSPQQKRVWGLHQNSSVYRVQCALLISGALKAQVLKEAVRMVMDAEITQGISCALILKARLFLEGESGESE